VGEHQKAASEVVKRETSFDAEKVTKILSLVAIPIVLAVFGWVIQNRLSERNVSQEYVKLAVSILEKPKSSDVPSGLRDWAVDLLNQNSPTKFSSETIRQLKTDEISLTELLSNLMGTANAGGGIAISPDEKTLATGQENDVAIWDIKSGNLIETLRGHTDIVTAVVYTPDAKALYSGSYDGTVFRWDIKEGRAASKLTAVHSPILGLAVSRDGRFLAVRSADGQVRMWDAVTMSVSESSTFRVPNNPAAPTIRERLSPLLGSFISKCKIAGAKKASEEWGCERKKT